MPRSLRRGGGRVEYLEDASPLLRELGSRLGMGVEVGEVGDDDWHGQGYRQDTHQGTQRTDHHSLQPNKLSFHSQTYEDSARDHVTEAYGRNRDETPKINNKTVRVTVTYHHRPAGILVNWFSGLG